MDELTHSNATENKEDDCQMAERKMSMKNRMKQLSALVLAATMAMGTYTSAFAADMTVYVRSIGKNATAPTQELSFTVHNVNSTMSIYDALDEAPETAGMLDAGVHLSSDWTYASNTDDWYLKSLSVTDTNKNKHFDATNNGGNTKLYKDSEGNYIGGVYEGNSWMWCPMTGSLNSKAYPDDITLSDQKCKDANFAIILSYDYSSFAWGDTTGTPEP